MMKTVVAKTRRLTPRHLEFREEDEVMEAEAGPFMLKDEAAKTNNWEQKTWAHQWR